jgi:hypothetical protein
MPRTPAGAASEIGRRPLYEVADIFRTHAPEYTASHRLSGPELRVLHAVQACRTAQMGGHLEHCDRCDFERPAYNSCRNRHCPKCQVLAKADWLEKRRAELLPVPYFHAVFTLPHEINALALHNRRLVYGLLFQTVSQTLQEFAADPKHGLGGQLGFTAILHTWDQKLRYHIHLHCLIPAGVLAFDELRWIPARTSFLFPVRALSRLFRGKFLHALRHARPQLVDPPSAEDFRGLLRDLWKKEWVVYCRPPFDGPDRTLDYLGRYTHRIAISNHRIVSVNGGRVVFRYRDRNDGDRSKVMTLPAQEFMRRFLLHVLPRSFVRIRHFGFLANRAKTRKLERCRQLLGADPPLPPAAPRSCADRVRQLTGMDLETCPVCGCGRMVVVTKLQPVRLRRAAQPRLPPIQAVPS